MNKFLMSFEDADYISATMARVLGMDIIFRAVSNGTMYVYKRKSDISEDECYAHSVEDPKLVVIGDNFRLKSFVGDPILKELRWSIDEFDYCERMLSIEISSLRSVHDDMLRIVEETIKKEESFKAGE